MAQTTDFSQLDLNATYSYADYLTWQFDGAVEIIKGKIMAMSPAPSTEHQGISWRFSGCLFNFLKDQPCRAFTAPFDVRLFDRHKSLIANREIFSVVQPDISVICDKTKIDSQGCLGAPDWVIEILSKGNSKKEMQLKYQLYQESGVKEYWLIYPYEKAVHQFVLDDTSEKYQLVNMYCGEDFASPHLFPNLKINLNEIFEDSFH